jgi:hypothetical protein
MMEESEVSSKQLFDVVFDPYYSLDERKKAIGVLRARKSPSPLMTYLKIASEDGVLDESRVEEKVQPLSYMPGRMVSNLLANGKGRKLVKNHVVGFLLSAVVMMSYNNLSLSQRKSELKSMLDGVKQLSFVEYNDVWFDALDDVVTKTANLLTPKD